MGATRDITPERNATEQELQQYETAHNRIQQLDTSNTFDATDPNQRLFFVSFDGTCNDRYSPDPDNIHTNPDLLQHMVPETNNVESIYVPGVATRNDNLAEHYYEAITGDGSEKRAVEAYEALRDQVQQWQAENPNVEVHISTAGFSRGTGSQRHFANLVDDRGIPDSDGNGYLIPPGEVHQDIMLMYDSVVTGQEDVLDLGIPDSVAHAVHLTADHENRDNFDSASIVDPFNPDDPGILEAGLPGAHSDIGGNYDYGGLSARSLALGYELLYMMGVPINDIPEEYQIDLNDTDIHDSGSLIDPANWETGEREVDVFGNPERRSEAQQQQAILEEQQKELEEEAATQQATTNRGAELNVMHSEIDLRNAMDPGDGMDISREGLGYLSSMNDYRDTVFHDGFVGDSAEAMVDGLEHGIGLGQAIDEGDGWQIASSTTSLLNDIDQIHDIDGGSCRQYHFFL